jgi:CMP-N-acetylneuraminic acid synthetase
MKIFAIIPIKHNSERVKNKNFKIFNEKPLFFWIINTLINVKRINKIIIDTDSNIIKNGIEKYFKKSMEKIIIYDRPENLRGGHISTNLLFMNVINDLKLDADVYFQTHTTNPLLSINTINKAIDTYKKNREKYETLFSVKTHHTRFYNKDGSDMNHNRYNLIPTQDLDPIYEENSCIYLFTKKSLFKYKARISEKSYLFKMSDIESTDIDWPEEFNIAELLHKYYAEPIQ